MFVSEVLIVKNLYLFVIKIFVDQFGGWVVDVVENSCIVELIVKSLRVDLFLSLMRLFGVFEVVWFGKFFIFMFFMCLLY